jgi:hypothetical protein
MYIFTKNFDFYGFEPMEFIASLHLYWTAGSAYQLTNLFENNDFSKSTYNGTETEISTADFTFL